MYIRLKNKNFSKKVNDFLEKNKIKYFFVLDGENIKYAILYIPNDFQEENFKEIEDLIEITEIKSAYKFVSREFKKSDTIIDIRGHLIGGDNFMFMAGPCSVENDKQIIDTAKAVKAAGATMLRGGVVKPRTSPYAFQGLGMEGIKLMKKAKEETGLPIVCEVMSIAQLHEFGPHLDMIQLGARNMQNFDLLKEVGKTNIPVLLKRGLSATIEEWLMSAEYILAGGNENVVLCERGIRTYETAYRNVLDLNAVPMIKKLTHLPIIVDSAHATGKHWMVKPLGMAGIAAGADGLMVEVHPEPDKALSDGPQSLKFEVFEDLMQDVEKIANVLGKTFKTK